MLKKVFGAIICFAAIVCAGPGHAQSLTPGQDTVVFEKSINIRWFGFARSFDIFNAEAQAEGILKITNLTPDRPFFGYASFNQKWYAVSSKRPFTEDVVLKGRNRICIILFGRYKASAEITVLQKGAPPVLPEASLTADPGTITEGDASTLSWQTQHADSAAIEPGIGDVAPEGDISISPEETTTYTLTATGPGGKATDSATVSVTHPPAISITEPDGSNDLADDTFTITWTDDDPDSNAAIALYYDTDAAGTDGTEIISGLSEDPDGSDDQYVWDTASLAEGDYYIYAVIDDGDHDPVRNCSEGPVTVIHAVPPTVNISADPETINPGEITTLTWMSGYADTCRITPDIGDVPLNGSVDVSPEATTEYTITATGPGGTATAAAEVSVKQPPNVSLDLSPAVINHGESATLTWSAHPADTVCINNGIGEKAASGSVTVTPEYTTTYTLTAIYKGESTHYDISLKVLGNPPAPLPEGSFGAAYQEFIPEDASLEAYDTQRFVVLTGLVKDTAGNPIAGAKVTIFDHPEYGSALTDAKGRYTLAAEGGGMHRLTFSDPDYLCVHRKVEALKNDLVHVEDIVLASRDLASTVVTFDGNPETRVTHKSSKVSDAFGSRSATLVFTGDMNAYEVDPYGNKIRGLSSITARATEYATSDSMPAKLPPTSSYTYCAEFEAEGVERVIFNKPVTVFVDNFLGFDVGEQVPSGYYDRDKGQWVASKNGLVVRLLDSDEDDVVDGLDIDDDGVPDDLDNDGETQDEVAGLDDSNTYLPGDTFWRVQVTHFSPWDFNWCSYTSLTGMLDFGLPGADEALEDEPPVCTGSYVRANSRILHENIPVPGTGMALHYTSNRAPGYKTVITVPASGNTVPASVKRIEVELTIAGRKFSKQLPAMANQQAEFTWDGLDVFGKPVEHTITAHTRVGFVYNSYYMQSGYFDMAFAEFGAEVTGVSSREEATLWFTGKTDVHRPPQKAGLIATGWSLTPHHYVDPADTTTLLKGNGTKIINNIKLIETIAGTGNEAWELSPDPLPATESPVSHPAAVCLDAEGNIYIASQVCPAIRKVDKDGDIHTIAGGPYATDKSDGIPAVQAKLQCPCAMDFDADGNLYIADSLAHKVRKIDKNGIITTVAEDGASGDTGDGGPAISARLHPTGVAVDANGVIYIADRDHYKVRKVTPNGTIHTIAGTGVQGCTGDGDRADQAELSQPYSVSVDSEGNLYIPGQGVIRKVDTNGIIRTIAGTYGYYGYSNDGGPAAQAVLAGVYAVEVDANDNLYFGQTDVRNSPGDPQNEGADAIRKIDNAGFITTVAGNGLVGFSGDGGPATRAQLFHPRNLCVDLQGNIYVPDYYNHVVRKVAAPEAFQTRIIEDEVVFETEYGDGYVIAATGRHKQTIDLETGSVRKTFVYDSGNRLNAITDQFGNQTTIHRYPDGTPYAITSPDGLTTELSIDTEGHLSQVDLPDGGIYDFTYTAGGLLTDKVEPNSAAYEYIYDEAGRITDTYDESGGHWRFDRTAEASGDITSTVTTGESNASTYIASLAASGAEALTVIDPADAQTLSTTSADGLVEQQTLADDTEIKRTYSLDPAFAYKYLQSESKITPAGLERSIQVDVSYEDTDADNEPDLITRDKTLNGKTTTLENDVLSSKKTITSPEGRTLTAAYNPDTLETTSTQMPGLMPTDYTYYADGKCQSVTTGIRETGFAYDANGYLASVTDPRNLTTYFTNDKAGRITHIDRPDGTSLEFSYDANGNMTVLTNPSGVDHEFAYNPVDLNSSYTTPLSGSYSYVYDKDRRLIRKNFPSGQSVYLDYTNPSDVDDKSRLWQIQTPEGNIDYTYLCGNKIESISKSLESITYNYDGELVTSETLAGTVNQSLDYTYNTDFNISSFTYAGQTENYTYDYDGLLTGAGEFTISRYNNPGVNETGLPYSVTNTNLNIDRTFNSYGETDSENTDVNGQGIYAWNITDRYPDGRIKTRTETMGGVTTTYGYTYDEMGRLETITKDGTLVEEYGYNDIPYGTRTYQMNTERNISGRTLSYDAEDRLLSTDNTDYQYNPDGFLESKTTAEGTTTYDYSAEGELLSVNLPDGTFIEYIYDPLGRRTAKRVDGTITRKYLWQGLTRLLAIYDGADNLLVRFKYADSRLPVAVEKEGATYYLAYDPVGSLRAVADSSGNVIKEITYDTFGYILNDINPDFEIPLGFAGGLHDRDTGLVRFGYRDYAPDTGRWTAKDPIGFAGGNSDLYGYCLNDPVNLLDPWGLKNMYESYSHFYSHYHTINHHPKSNFTPEQNKAFNDMIRNTMDNAANFFRGTGTTVLPKELLEKFMDMLMETEEAEACSNK